MKNVPLFVLLLLPLASGFGQVTGKVTDLQDEPVGFINVALHVAADSSLVGGATTQEDGRFIIPHAATGRYYLAISGIGYQPFYSGHFVLTAENPQIRLDDLRILEGSQALSEVVVSARKDLIQHTPTGQTFHVQNSLMTKGSNALQVLERLPGVFLDRRYGQISLNGQSGVTVLFDGRRMQMSMEELMALLESTVADNIEKVELITSPTAQYDADGGAGIINIVFKKRVETGTRINVSATAGYGFREKAATSLGITRGFQKADLRLAYSYLHDYDKSGFQGYGRSNIPVNGGESSDTFANFTEQLQRSHALHLTTEFRPTSKTTVGGDINVSFARSNNRSHIANSWDVKDREYIRSEALAEGLNRRRNLIASVFLKNKLSEQSHLQVDLSYIGYTNNSPTVIQADYFDRQGQVFMPQNTNFFAGNQSESLSSIHVGVLKADYSRQIGSRMNLELGAKGSYSKNANDSRVERNVLGVWETDPRSQSSIQGEERVLAGYAQWKFDVSEKFVWQMGLRYEYWRRDISTFDRPFVIAKPFPSLLFTYKINEHTTAGLAYHRRISRPLYVDLISNLFYNDPTAIFTGNPLLKPTITDAVKVDLNLKNLHIDLSVQQDINPILRYQLTANETNELLVVSPQNLEYQKSLNLSVNYPVQVWKWWKMTLGSISSLRTYQLSYSAVPASKTYVFQNLNLHQQLQLPGRLDVEVSGWYNFPFYEGTNKLKGFGVLNMGIAHKLNKDRGTFQLALPDLLRSFRVHTHISGMSPVVFGINGYVTWRAGSALYQVVKLTYTRSFGKQGRDLNYRLEAEERERVR